MARKGPDSVLQPSPVAHAAGSLEYTEELHILGLEPVLAAQGAAVVDPPVLEAAPE